MNEFKIKYKFNPGDPVWFLYNNEVSKGVIDSLIIRYETEGLKSRGYNVKEFFNKILQVLEEDKEFEGNITYNVNLLDFVTEEFKSSPHIFIGDKRLFSSKEELIDSLK